EGMWWGEVCGVAIAGAGKPEFFTSQAPFYEVATPEGLLRPAVAALRPGGDYLGGSAARLERDLGISGDEILYVGDHMFGDVRATKRVLRWRTALILRELEAEGQAIGAFRATDLLLAARMREKGGPQQARDQMRPPPARR